MKGQNDRGQQDRESPRGTSSSETVSEKTSENLREVPFCDFVFITSVPLRGFRRSSRRPFAPCVPPLRPQLTLARAGMLHLCDSTAACPAAQ